MIHCIVQIPMSEKGEPQLFCCADGEVGGIVCYIDFVSIIGGGRRGEGGIEAEYFIVIY